MMMMMTMMKSDAIFSIRLSSWKKRWSLASQFDESSRWLDCSSCVFIFSIERRYFLSLSLSLPAALSHGIARSTSRLLLLRRLILCRIARRRLILSDDLEISTERSFHFPIVMLSRRRCRRYCFHRFLLLLLTCLSTIFTIGWIYSPFSQGAFLRSKAADRLYFVDEIDLLDARWKASGDLRLISKDELHFTPLTCQYPTLALDNPEIWNHLQPVTKARPDCEKANNWVYVENGNYPFVLTVEKSNRCFQEHFAYPHKHYVNMALLFVLTGRFSGRKTIFLPWKVLDCFLWWTKCRWSRTFSVPIAERETEVFIQIFIQALCSTQVFTCGKREREPMELLISFSSTSSRHVWNPMVKTHLGYNVLIFGFDSVSRMTFMRFLPKSYRYLIKELGSIVMKGNESVRQMKTSDCFLVKGITLSAMAHPLLYYLFSLV